MIRVIFLSIGLYLMATLSATTPLGAEREGDPSISLDQVKYWQELLSRSDLAEFIAAYDGTIEFDWPACSSRSYRVESLDHSALLNDICRGNAFYFIDLLIASYDRTPAQEPAPQEFWSGLDRLLNFRNDLYASPSYVSFVLIDAINLYVYTVAIERLYSEWSAGAAEPTLTRLQASPLTMADMAWLIEKETGRAVEAIAQRYVEDKFAESVAAGHQRNTTEAVRDLLIREALFVTLQYLADPENVNLPDDYSEMAKIPLLAGSGFGRRGSTSSADLLANRNIAVLMARLWYWDLAANIRARYFLRFVANTEKPHGPPDRDAILDTIASLDLPEVVTTRFRRRQGDPGSVAAAVYRHLSTGTFEQPRRRMLK